MVIEIMRENWMKWGGVTCLACALTLSACNSTKVAERDASSPAMAEASGAIAPATAPVPPTPDFAFRTVESSAAATMDLAPDAAAAEAPKPARRNSSVFRRPPPTNVTAEAAASPAPKPDAGPAAKEKTAAEKKPAGEKTAAPGNAEPSKNPVASDKTVTPEKPAASDKTANSEKPAGSAPGKPLSEAAAATNAEAEFVVSGEPRLRPGLVINISVTVTGRREVEEPQRRISPAGTVTLPLLGSVMVAGKTVEEVQKEIAKRYGEFFVRPEVVVEFVMDENLMLSSPWGHVTLNGKVRSPGRVSIPPTRDLTVSRALQLAGGVDPTANDKGITVTRTLPDGKKKIFKVNLRTLGTGKTDSEDIVLEPGDVVFVPESWM